ncbi:hypothetical protein EVAR_98757_1 [Eumeta japonica]|uniref:Uncharacterized protein n=1 Tax=Eumeta variegata TaxID=151549 RepID=A0A4C1YYY9_EUMVA|nr:hypothetical protein EVAR_98757_1 [Eumeta japonica]
MKRYITSGLAAARTPGDTNAALACSQMRAPRGQRGCHGLRVLQQRVAATGIRGRQRGQGRRPAPQARQQRAHREQLARPGETPRASDSTAWHSNSKKYFFSTSRI